MATETDEHQPVAGVALAHELTQVDHAGGHHVGGAGVATLDLPGSGHTRSPQGGAT